MNLNLSASVNIFRLLARPSLCLPHGVVSTFNDIPVPLDSAFAARSGGKQPEIKAVVLDKDDCFAFPESSEVWPSYQVCIGRWRAPKTLRTRAAADLVGKLQQTARGVPWPPPSYRFQHSRRSQL